MKNVRFEKIMIKIEMLQKIMFFRTDLYNHNKVVCSNIHCIISNIIFYDFLWTYIFFILFYKI